MWENELRGQVGDDRKKFALKDPCLQRYIG